MPLLEVIGGPFDGLMLDYEALTGKPAAEGDDIRHAGDDHQFWHLYLVMRGKSGLDLIYAGCAAPEGDAAKCRGK